MKLIKSIKRFVNRISNFIDKKIVVPITKLVLLITSKFDTNSRKFENLLSRNNTLLFVSLFLAIVIFIVIDQKIIVFTDNAAEVLKNQPVTAVYNEEAYVVEGLPETVDITLIGSKTDLYIAKQSSSHDVTVDLNGLKPGTHKVSIEYNQNVGKIDYMVNPSTATVIIYQKVSETRTISYDILNQDKLDSKLVIDSVGYSTDKVVIKGAEHQLKNVSSVKALVDINNLVTQNAGTVSLKDVALKAYDNEGNVVDVEMVPSKIDVDVNISSPSKEVPIKVIPNGEVSFGLAIDSIDVNETKVTVYGDESILDDLKYIPVQIDVSDLKENREYKLELSKPVGVRSMSVNNVTVTVKLSSVSNKTLDNIGIEPRNLADNLKVQALDASSSLVSVTLTGVSSVVDTITADDVIAYIDLDGYVAGTYEVDVQVEGTDVRVQYKSKTKKVKIKIVEK